MRIDRIRNIEISRRNRERLKNSAAFPSVPNGDLWSFYSRFLCLSEHAETLTYPIYCSLFNGPWFLYWDVGPFVLASEAIMQETPRIARLAVSRRPHSFSRRERHVHLHVLKSSHKQNVIAPSIPRFSWIHLISFQGRLLRGRSANYEPWPVVRCLEDSLIKTAESDGPRSYILLSLCPMLFLKATGHWKARTF